MGILTGTPLLVGVSLVPLGFVGAVGFDTAPTPVVSLKRDLALADDETDPDWTATESEPFTGDPGQRVTVRLAIRNEGTEPLVDVRIKDGLPEDIPLVDGTPDACLTLGPEETEVIEYDIELRRGEYTFSDAIIRTRGTLGTVHRTETESVQGEETVGCFPTVEDVPLDDGTNNYAGEIPTNESGSGVEFYSVRDYEPGDPVRSIDWRRYASTRELATIEFRAERSTQVVCLIDHRESQRRAQSDDHLPALDLTATATRRTFETVIDSGYPAGIMGFDDRLVCSIEPGTDAGTQKRGVDFLDEVRKEHADGREHARTQWGNPVTKIPTLLPGEAQVVLFSSFVDDLPVDIVEQLRIHGYPVCVVSPDVASGREDASGRLTALTRRTRLADARAQEARVVDWDQGESLGVILNRIASEVSSR
jgi:uncharacterized protein (DUF58 family)